MALTGACANLALELQRVPLRHRDAAAIADAQVSQDLRDDLGYTRDEHEHEHEHKRRKTRDEHD